MPGLRFDQRQRLLEDLASETEHSKETFTEHFRASMVISILSCLSGWLPEIMTFGCILTLFRGVHPDIRKQAAVVFGVHDNVLSSWLLTSTRCATLRHHGRLWNRVFGVQPKIPSKIEAWNKPVPVAGQRMFTILTICKHCLGQIAPQSHWPTRWRELLAAYSYIPRGSMGIPANWEECPIWTKPKEPNDG